MVVVLYTCVNKMTLMEYKHCKVYWGKKEGRVCKKGDTIMHSFEPPSTLYRTHPHPLLRSGESRSEPPTVTVTERERGVREERREGEGSKNAVRLRGVRREDGRVLEEGGEGLRRKRE